MGWDLGFGIGIWDGIWDWNGILTNGMGWDGMGMGFDTNGHWDSPIPISMGGKYSCSPNSTMSQIKLGKVLYPKLDHVTN